MKKKLLFLLLFIPLLTGCTSGTTRNAMNYNKERIENTEQYLKEYQIITD